MMTRNKTVATRESNYNIDHKNVVIIWISLFCRWSKIFFLKTWMKEDNDLTFLVLRFLLDHIFGPKKDKLFCTVFVFRRDMPNVISDLVLYLQSEGLNTSWIYPCTIPFQYLKTFFAIALLLFFPGILFIFFFYLLVDIDLPLLYNTF